MSWRIHENVLRGEIDNRTRGRVIGRIWLQGVAESLVLDLRGDCQPDLAGCVFRFENPAPVPMTTPPLAARQSGTAGEITAARKVRVFDLPVERARAVLKAGGAPPGHLASALYLEWFSDLSGRVIIESADYRLETSEPAWRFSADELRERERLAGETEANPFAIEISGDAAEEEWDEFRCEQFLRESDARTERYGALLKKYAGHPEADRLIAREMGWDWVESALDAQAEGEGDDVRDNASPAFEESSELDEQPDPAREGIDWVRAAGGRIVHPLESRAHDMLHALLDELKSDGHLPDCDDSALGDFVGHYMNLTAKLAGALGGVAHGWGVEPGMTVARLKRILVILNEALTASDSVAIRYLSADRLAHYRAGLFVLREDILVLIARLRARE